MLQKRLVVFRFTVPVENTDIGIPKSASCKGESSMFALPDSRLAVANPRRGFDVCLNPRAPSSMLDGSLNVAVSPFELIAIKKKLPQVTSSNWNSLLSCNSINTPSTLTMGWQGFSLWLALVGAMQGKMAVLGSQALRLQRFNLYDGRTEFASAAPAALQLLRWPYRVLKRCACRASTF